MPDRTAQMQLLVDYYLGYNATLLIRLGADTGLWQAVAAAQPVTAAALAAELGFEERYVAHFLRTAQALRLLERDAAGYALTEHMDKLLADPAHSSYLAGMAGFHTISGRDFERMPQWLRSGETYSFQAHEDDFIAGVGEVTAGIARFFARSVIPQLPGIEGRDDISALDLGCGVGGNLQALAEAFPRGRVLGLDVEPRSVAQANERLRRAGLQERAAARVQAAEDLDEAGTFDLVTLVQVLHETQEAVRDSILAGAFRALRPGGVLAVIDEPYPEDDAELLERPSTAMTQFIEIFWGNVLLAPSQQKALAERHGFEGLQQFVPPPSLISVMIARRPGG